MSAVDQALDHARVAERAGDLKQRDFWAQEAVRFLLDIRLPLPAPSTVSAHGAGFRFTCHTCHAEACVPDVAGLMDAAEQHEGCGGEFLYWRCPTCGGREFHSHSYCRFCSSPRAGERLLSRNPNIITKPLKAYSVISMDRRLLAEVRCNSLLRAQRAARGMFPGVKLLVRLDGLDRCWRERGHRPVEDQ